MDMKQIHCDFWFDVVGKFGMNTEGTGFVAHWQ